MVKEENKKEQQRFKKPHYCTKTDHVSSRSSSNSDQNQELTIFDSDHECCNDAINYNVDKESYDVPPFLQGFVQFGKLKKDNHFDLLKKECIARNYPQDKIRKETKISELKKKIKEHEKKHNGKEGNIKYFKLQGEKNMVRWYPLILK